MITKRDSVSGSGSGVNKEDLPAFITALQDFEKLIRTIHKHYEANPSNTFSGQFHLLNNWHNTYKIDLRREEFPYHLCNGIDVFYCGWNSVHLISKWPLKFKGPTFSGGNSENMSVALVTEVSLGENSMNSFLDNKQIPEWLKEDVLRRLEEVYGEKVKTRYEADMERWHQEAERRKVSIEEAKEQITLDEVEIPLIEERIAFIRQELKRRAQGTDLPKNNPEASNE